ncbi:lytic polysaccharide monooxygenase [Pseudomonas putida]
MNAVIQPRLALLGAAVLVTACTALLVSQQAAAHGYMSYPPSRAKLCQDRLNTDCGGAQYEPHSVGETLKGFPATGPADGKLASGIERFGAMDAQSATRWHKTEITEREIAFDWRFTTAHSTTGWEYFITRVGWNPNEPLTRASFDLTPFCTVAFDGGFPTGGSNANPGDLAQKHQCTLPADRQGYHVIYGVWTVNDTANAFYNAVDVDIQTDPYDDGWKNVGSFAPLPSLIAGDVVTARAFTGIGESAPYSISLVIDNNEMGHQDNWSLALAQKLNAAQPLVRAGQRNAQGQIEAQRGMNLFYAQPESGVVSYQMDFQLVGDPGAYARLEDLLPEYELQQGRVDVDLKVATNRTLNVEVTVFDAQHKAVGTARQIVNSTTTPLSIAVRSAPGPHQVKLLARSDDGRINLQALHDVRLTGEAGGGDYEYVYGEGVQHYKGGTTVLQTDGKVYRCLSDQVAPWCQNTSTMHYAPGVGHAWQSAWEVL